MLNKKELVINSLIVIFSLVVSGVAASKILIREEQEPKAELALASNLTLVPSPTNTPEPTLTPVKTPPRRNVLVNSKCIIQISGWHYDVTAIANGQNAFRCGEDMTAEYQKLHGNDMSRLEAYWLERPSPTMTPLPSRRREREDDD